MEEWRVIPGHSGYEASNEGRIKSTRFGRIRIMRPRSSTPGYKRVYVGKCSCTSRTHGVHRLVMAAFHGESKLLVHHINGNPSDNRLSNLRYMTNREHGILHIPLTEKGFGITNSNLTETEVLALRIERASGSTIKSLSKKYGVGIGACGYIVRGETWTKVGGPRTFAGKPHGRQRNRRSSQP